MLSRNYSKFYLGGRKNNVRLGLSLVRNKLGILVKREGV